MGNTLRPAAGPSQLTEDQALFKSASGLVQRADIDADSAYLSSMPRRRSIARADFSSPPSLASVKASTPPFCTTLCAVRFFLIDEALFHNQ